MSAGLLPFRHVSGVLEVFLVHPGGPFWAKKDDGVWSLSKGEYDPTEDALAAARREFHEETGFDSDSEFLPLGKLKQPSGKTITAWAFRSDCDPAQLHSSMFSMEWPPRSGRSQEFPEVDRASWFQLASARTKILKGQLPFLDALLKLVGGDVQRPASAPGSSHEDAQGSLF